jgi:hypothetical protein
MGRSLRDHRHGALGLACAGCASTLLCPADWAQLGAAHWRVAFRCGECQAWSDVLLSNAQAAALDCELDRQLTTMRRAADRLDRERMTAQAQAFIAALRGGHLLPADFVR